MIFICSADIFSSKRKIQLHRLNKERFDGVNWLRPRCHWSSKTATHDRSEVDTRVPIWSL